MHNNVPQIDKSNTHDKRFLKIHTETRGTGETNEVSIRPLRIKVQESVLTVKLGGTL
jgi:hypothetical protein